MLNIMPGLATADNLTPLALGAMAVVSFILFLLEHRSNQELLKKISDAGFKNTEEKSTGILHRALLKARKIIGEAQAESITTTRKFESEYAQKLAAQLNQAQIAFSDYLEELKKQSQQSHLLNEQSLKQRSDEIFAQFEKNLSVFLASMEQKSTTTLDNELSGVRVAIENYKKQQLSLVEENIIAMLEKTISLVLVKKITLKDELDLVYEALDKAKVEKFIV